MTGCTNAIDCFDSSPSMGLASSGLGEMPHPSPVGDGFLVSDEASTLLADGARWMGARRASVHCYCGRTSRCFL